MKYHARRADGEYTIFTTVLCPTFLGGCGSQQEIKVKTVDVIRYNDGAHIQDAFPYLSAGHRERLLSGLCSNCYDKMFDPDYDDQVVDDICNGMCVLGSDILEAEDVPGVDLSLVAYPHPDCPAHGHPGV